MTVQAGGRHALTHAAVVARFAHADLLRVQLATGRTHQIRVHLQATGHPVVGDPSYGGARAPLAIGRPFLHAGGLEFEHPFTGDPMTFEAPLPPDLSTVLARLEP